MMKTMMTKLSAARGAFVVSMALGVAAVSGCGSTSTVRGRVVPGDIGIVTIVPEQDARLASTDATRGIGDVKVSLKKSQAVIATAQTGPDGWFTMKLDLRASGVRYDIEALGPSIYPVRSTSYPPAEGQVMLIVADERGVAAGR